MAIACCKCTAIHCIVVSHTRPHHTHTHTHTHTQQFIENYPQFRKLSGTVSKHVAVVSELSRIVNNHQLMGVSETEQDLVTGTDRGKAMAVSGVWV